eukprot:g2340.t1
MMMISYLIIVIMLGLVLHVDAKACEHTIIKGDEVYIKTETESDNLRMDVKGIPLQVQEFDWAERMTLRTHKQQQHFHVELDGKKITSRLNRYLFNATTIEKEISGSLDDIKVQVDCARSTSDKVDLADPDDYLSARSSLRDAAKGDAPGDLLLTSYNWWRGSSLIGVTQEPWYGFELAETPQEEREVELSLDFRSWNYVPYRSRAGDTVEVFISDSYPVSQDPQVKPKIQLEDSAWEKKAVDGESALPVDRFADRQTAMYFFGPHSYVEAGTISLATGATFTFWLRWESTAGTGPTRNVLFEAIDNANVNGDVNVLRLEAMSEGSNSSAKLRLTAGYRPLHGDLPMETILDKTSADRVLRNDIWAFIGIVLEPNGRASLFLDGQKKEWRDDEEYPDDDKDWAKNFNATIHLGNSKWFFMEERTFNCDSLLEVPVGNKTLRIKTWEPVSRYDGIVINITEQNFGSIPSTATVMFNFPRKQTFVARPNFILFTFKPVKKHSLEVFCMESNLKFKAIRSQNITLRLEDAKLIRVTQEENKFYIETLKSKKSKVEINMNSQELRKHTLRVDGVDDIKFPSRKLMVRVRACTEDGGEFWKEDPSCGEWSCCKKSDNLTLARLNKDYVIELEKDPSYRNIDGRVAQQCSGGKTICPSLSNAIQAQDYKVGRTVFTFAHMGNASYNESLPVRFLRADSVLFGNTTNIRVPFNYLAPDGDYGGKGEASVLGIVSLSTRILIENCAFTSNYGDFGPLLFKASSAGSVILRNTMFDGNIARFSGGGFYAEGGALEFVNVSFKGNSAGDNGGALYSLGSSFTADTTHFDSNTAMGSGGALYVKMGQGSQFRDVTFLNNSVLGSNGGGGSMHVERTSLQLRGSVSFQSSTSAGNGGAISCIATALSLAESYGGAIMANGARGLDVSDGVRFISNIASEGGALAAIACDEESITVLDDTQFRGNSARVGGGGAIFWDEMEKEPQVLRRTLLSNSSNVTDTLLTSTSCNLCNVIDFSQQIQTSQNTTDELYSSTLNFAPNGYGQNFASGLRKLRTGYPSTRLPNASQAPEEKRVFIEIDNYLEMPPVWIILADFYNNRIRSLSKSYEVQASAIAESCSITFNIGHCPRGRQLKIIEMKKIIIPSLSREEFKKFEIEQKFESSFKGTKLYDSEELPERCFPGYEGRLCHTCAIGYGREGLDRCRICPEGSTNILLSVLGITIVLVVLILFISQTMRSAADDRSSTSMLLKTAAAYAQVLSIASSFPYQWPRLIVWMFEIMETVTSVSDGLLNSDCTISQQIEEKYTLTYNKALLYCSGPVVYVFCCCLFWLAVHCYESIRSEEEVPVKVVRNRVVVSTIIAIVILHPTLTKQILLLLMCVPMEYTSAEDGITVLFIDTKIRSMIMRLKSVGRKARIAYVGMQGAVNRAQVYIHDVSRLKAIVAWYLKGQVASFIVAVYGFAIMLLWKRPFSPARDDSPGRSDVPRAYSIAYFFFGAAIALLGLGADISAAVQASHWRVPTSQLNHSFATCIFKTECSYVNATLCSTTTSLDHNAICNRAKVFATTNAKETFFAQLAARVEMIIRPYGLAILVLGFSKLGIAAMLGYWNPLFAKDIVEKVMMSAVPSSRARGKSWGDMVARSAGSRAKKEKTVLEMVDLRLDEDEARLQRREMKKNEAEKSALQQMRRDHLDTKFGSKPKGRVRRMSDRREGAPRVLPQEKESMMSTLKRQGSLLKARARSISKSNVSAAPSDAPTVNPIFNTAPVSTKGLRIDGASGWAYSQAEFKRYYGKFWNEKWETARPLPPALPVPQPPALPGPPAIVATHDRSENSNDEHDLTKKLMKIVKG